MGVPNRSEAWEESLDPRTGGTWDFLNPIKDIGSAAVDAITGNEAAAGRALSKGVKDVEHQGKGVIKGLEQAGRDVKNWSNDAWKFTKQYGPEIAMGIGMGALALTGVGLAADAAIGAGLATDVAATTALDVAGTAAADTTATAVTDTAATAVEDTASTALKDTASTALKDTARTVTKDTASTVGKGAMEDGYSGAASATEDAASTGGRLQNLKDMIKNNPVVQKAQDIYNSAPVQTTQNILKNPAVQMGAGAYLSSDGGNTTNVIQQAPAGTPAAPASFAAAPTDTSMTAEGQSLYGPNYTGGGLNLNFSQGNIASKQDKILDLVYEFGLHPEDIKRSLTSWQ